MNPTCSPGYYTSLPQLTGIVTFSPGNYTFQGAVTVGSNAIVRFDSGQYTFDSGISLGSFSKLTTPNMNTAFFYFPQTGSLSAGSIGDSVQLSAPTTGPDAGILIDQPASNTSPLSVGGGNSASALNGIVDVPTASVTLGFNSDTFTMGTLIASSLTLGYQATVTVGSS
jgi:hypothetical protein